MDQELIECRRRGDWQGEVKVLCRLGERRKAYDLIKQWIKKDWRPANQLMASYFPPCPVFYLFFNQYFRTTFLIQRERMAIELSVRLNSRFLLLTNPCFVGVVKDGYEDLKSKDGRHTIQVNCDQALEILNEEDFVKRARLFAKNFSEVPFFGQMDITQDEAMGMHEVFQAEDGHSFWESDLKAHFLNCYAPDLAKDELQQLRAEGACLELEQNWARHLSPQILCENGTLGYKRMFVRAAALAANWNPLRDSRALMIVKVDHADFDDFRNVPYIASSNISFRMRPFQRQLAKLSKHRMTELSFLQYAVFCMPEEAEDLAGQIHSRLFEESLVNDRPLTGTVVATRFHGDPEEADDWSRLYENAQLALKVAEDKGLRSYFDWQ